MASEPRMSLLDEASKEFKRSNYESAADKFTLLMTRQPDFKNNPLLQLNLGRCFFELK